MQGRSIMQMIFQDGETKYREWDQEVAVSGMDSPESKFLQGRLSNEAKLALFDDFWAATQDDERLWASD